MLPILKQGSRGLVVKDLQEALNRSSTIHHDSALAPLAVDGAFGPKTADRVREYQKPRGLSVDGQVGPKTRGFLFVETYDLVTAAQQHAITWVLLARAAVRKSLTEAVGIQGGTPGRSGLSSVERDALKTHFHIDLGSLQPGGASQTVALLTKVATTFDSIQNLLQTASIYDEIAFCRVGRHELEDEPGTSFLAGFALAYVTQDRDFVRFTPNFANDDGLLLGTVDFSQLTPAAHRISNVIHECAHFVDRDNHDFAYEVPPPNGRPGGASTTGQDYSHITADEAVVNGASYSTYAQHILFRFDFRPYEPFMLTRNVCEAPGSSDGQVSC
jgi:hypothetical protein